MRKIQLIGLAATAIILMTVFSGCATQDPHLYSWGSYESQLYSFMMGESREAQMEALENDIKLIESEAKNFPPGFFAHIGLLYLEAGNGTGAAACFEREKALFPEAATFMDFLLKGLGGR